jgi:deazaflavin-dependent oxidoreductase (nitroreductase family)
VTSEKVVDSPSGWVAKHIKEYVETDGEKGHTWQGVPTLLLTMRGRKTGKLRRTALIYGRDGDSYIVVASMGGAPKHPKWYLNLVANPEVEIQVGPKITSGRARTADQDERARLWPKMAEIWPQYDAYQKKTDRQIPIVIIDPARQRSREASSATDQAPARSSR